MHRFTAAVLAAFIVSGCATAPQTREAGPIAIVPSPYEPAAQFESGGGINGGAVIGAAGGAGIGAMSAQASAGLLCTVGGPLCLIVVVPAAIVGGLVGGVAGGVVDAIVSDPGNRIAKAREEIEQAVADMRFTDAVASQTYLKARDDTARPVSFLREADHKALAAQGIAAALEVGMSEIEILPREKEMALTLRARARLYRTSDGALIDERVSEAQTGYRTYEDWAADGARQLRVAVDQAVAQLSSNIVSPR